MAAKGAVAIFVARVSFIFCATVIMTAWSETFPESCTANDNRNMQSSNSVVFADEAELNDHKIAQNVVRNLEIGTQFPRIHVCISRLHGT